MAASDNLRVIISRQKEVLAALEAEQRALENSDVTKENAKLHADLKKLRADFEKAASEAASLAAENAGLKNALYEQIYNEKVKLVNWTAQKLDIYFASSVEGESNRLTALENTVSARINSMRQTLLKNNIDAGDELYAKLDELSWLLNSKVTEARSRMERLSGAFTPAERAELEALKNEQVGDEQIRAVAKKNNLESFVGLKVLNAVGVLLLIVGAIALSRGITMFLLGGVMLVVGEFLNRKKPNIFSLGMTAGGVGVLYAALATSYFNLGLLGAVPAIAVCALIAAGAFVLSTRYDSQTIAVFALIGGYFPMFSSSIGRQDSGAVYGIMLYFIGLNLLAFLISFSKKWRVASFIGLGLNIVGAVYIVSSFYFYGPGYALEKTSVILYVLFAFLIYTAIPVIGTYRAKVKFQTSDIVLLAINTFFSSLIMYGVFYQFDLEDYHGLLAMAFAVIYLLLGRLIEKEFAGAEPYARELFYLTGLAFAVLIIPFQFGRAWLSLGWLAEGVLLTSYGVLKNRKGFIQKGYIICGLCLAAFIMFDVTWMWQPLFPYKYLAVTLGSLIILGAYMLRNAMYGKFVRIYKYFALVNAWFYVLYLIGELESVLLYSRILPDAFPFHVDYLMSAACITATLCIAYAIPRIKPLAGQGIRVLSIVIYSIGILWLAALNLYDSPVRYGYFSAATPNLAVTITGTAVLVALGLLSALAVRDLMKIIVMGKKLGIEWYPMIISAYCVVILTQNLITQYGLSFASFVISIIYVITALAWIIFGFARRYSFIRRFGLGLSILAVIKLFLIDLLSLTRGYRIVSYFALGITLIAISFVYQYFSKRLELKGVVSVDPDEDI